MRTTKVAFDLYSASSGVQKARPPAVQIEIFPSFHDADNLVGFLTWARWRSGVPVGSPIQQFFRECAIHDRHAPAPPACPWNRTRGRKSSVFAWCGNNPGLTEK